MQLKKFKKLQIRAIMKNAIKDCPEEELTDEAIDRWLDEFGEKDWQMAISHIQQEISPREVTQKEETSIKAVYIVSEDGFKDNEVYHNVATMDGMVRIKDTGVKELETGVVYTWPVVRYYTDDTENFALKRDDVPMRQKKLTDKKFYEWLNGISKRADELKDGELAIIKVKITHKIKQFGEKSGNPKPWYVDDDNGNKHGVQFNILGVWTSGVFDEHGNEDGQEYININFFPQCWGKTLFKDIFPDGYEEDVLPLSGDEQMGDALLNWLVPPLPNMLTHVVARFKVEAKENGTGNWISAFPCSALLMDADGQLPDIEGEEETETEEEDEIEEEAVPVADLEPATVEFIRKVLKVNPGADIDRVNAILERKGKVATEKDFKEAQKLPDAKKETKKPPAKKKAAKKKTTKKKTTKKKAGKK
jgi:hypothetical protein